jgi:hypothetical protein
MAALRLRNAFALVWALNCTLPAYSQELGQLETFGSDGRQFSAGTIDYFLVTRQRYVTEDSSGYQGDVRAVRKFPGGGFEIVLKRYTARCAAPFDNLLSVSWNNPGEESTPHIVDIKNAAKAPARSVKESYNLFWAACHGKYRKFK